MKRLRWSYLDTSINPANVGTRERGVKKVEGHTVWLNGPDILLREGADPQPPTPAVIVQKTNIADDLLLKRHSRRFESDL